MRVFSAALLTVSIWTRPAPVRRSSGYSLGMRRCHSRWHWNCTAAAMLVVGWRTEAILELAMGGQCTAEESAGPGSCKLSWLRVGLPQLERAFPTVDRLGSAGAGLMYV